MSLNAPHSPFNVPKEYYELYENESDLLESQKRFYGIVGVQFEDQPGSGTHTYKMQFGGVGGGSGGGGPSGNNGSNQGDGTAGTLNTGSGGGGADGQQPGSPGPDYPYGGGGGGAPGIVIIRYLTSQLG